MKLKLYGESEKALGVQGLCNGKMFRMVVELLFAKA
jgi:hypothetical protein